MKVIIDRIEENIAVVELPDGSMTNLPITLFDNAKEGDVVNISVEESDIKDRRNELKKKLDTLFGKTEV
jgi:hypothetical protein